MNVKHGLYGTPTYQAWASMVARCTRDTCPSFPNYGGRGITVCERWMTFDNFLADVGERPGDGYSLDRYPSNDGPYEPGNVRWATREQQDTNKRTSRFIVLNGERKTLAQWARQHGLRQDTVSRRLSKGDSVERALRPVTSESFRRSQCHSE